MHSRKTHLALSLILATAAVALSSASVFAAKPPSHPKNATTVDLLLAPGTPPCSELTEVTGIYQDGLGTYQNVGWATRVNLHLQPKCSDNRDIIALLPGELTGPTGPLSGDWATCTGFTLNTPLLRIPSLLDAQTGVVGQDPGIGSVKYATHIDSDGDGSFETGVHLYWHEGIHLTRMELTNPNRTVYELTTELTSDYAEVIKAGASLGTFCVPLRLTVTRMK